MRLYDEIIRRTLSLLEKEEEEDFTPLVIVCPIKETGRTAEGL